MAEQVRKLHGITKDTPKNILLGAGTIHRGLKFDAEKKTWNFNESIIGATSGGSEVEILGEFIDIPVDGAFVKVKGLTFKQGGTATIKTNMIELSPETFALTAQARISPESPVPGYKEIKIDGNIKDGDYVEDFAFVGNTTENQPIIVIFKYGLCRSGLKISSKQKEASIVETVIEAYADVEGDLTTLPVLIYYPEPAKEPPAEPDDESEGDGKEPDPEAGQ